MALEAMLLLEAGLISERTKAALKAAKARGAKLGCHGAEVLASRYRDEACQRAKELEPIIREMQGKGYSHGHRTHQAQGENSARWSVASANREDGYSAPRRLMSGG